MTVDELIAELLLMPSDARVMVVVITKDNGLSGDVKEVYESFSVENAVIIKG